MSKKITWHRSAPPAGRSPAPGPPSAGHGRGSCSPPARPSRPPRSTSVQGGESASRVARAARDQAGADRGEQDLLDRERGHPASHAEDQPRSRTHTRRLAGGPGPRRRRPGGSTARSGIARVPIPKPGPVAEPREEQGTRRRSPPGPAAGPPSPGDEPADDLQEEDRGDQRVAEDRGDRGRGPAPERIITACGSSANLVHLIASRARPPPSAISGASGPTTHPAPGRHRRRGPPRVRRPGSSRPPRTPPQARARRGPGGTSRPARPAHRPP